MGASLLGIDFGTSNTVAVLHRDGHGTPLLFDGSPVLPSAVFVDPTHGLLVGRDAERAAGAAPAHLERNPKRRIDEQTVWLGEREIGVPDLIAAVLHQVWVEVHRVLGQPPDRVVLTYPAGWGNQRLRVLADAAARAGLGTPDLIAEPAAAAWYFITSLGQRVAPGRCVVVYDFGAGTFDVAVLRRSPEGFDVLAADGLNDCGGLDLDAAIVGHLRELTPAPAWGALDWPQTTADRRARRLLWEEVRAVKEQLSRHPSATLHVPVVEADLHVTREEFERLARPLLARTVAVTLDTLRNARIGPDAVAGVFLVGGSSRIPLAAVLLHQELGIAPTVIEQPELVVASGAGSPLTARAVPVAAPPAFVPPVSVPPAFPSPVSVPPAGSAPPPVSVPPAAREPVSAPPAEPLSPADPRRRGALRAAGVIFLIGAVLGAALPASRYIWEIATTDTTLGLGFSVDGEFPDVLVGQLADYLIAAAVALVAAALAVRSDRLRWTGAGLLLGTGLFAVGSAVWFLGIDGAFGLGIDYPSTYGFGYVLMALGGLLAFVAVRHNRPYTTARAPVRPVPATVLIALAVVTTLLYVVLRFAGGEGGPVGVFDLLWTAAATLAVPVWAVVARPAHLGAGLMAGLLAVVLPTVLDLGFVYRAWGPLLTLGWVVYCLLGLAMFGAAIAVVRGNASPRTG